MLYRANTVRINLKKTTSKTVLLRRNCPVKKSVAVTSRANREGQKSAATDS